MFEVVVRFRQREEVIETVASLEIAAARVQAYLRQRLTAYLRPAMGRATATQSDPVGVIGAQEREQDLTYFTNQRE